jgi:hypothetical protein
MASKASSTSSKSQGIFGKNYDAGIRAGALSGAIGGFVIGVLSLGGQALVEGHTYSALNSFLLIILTVFEGIVIYGLILSWFYVSLYDKIPTKSPITKAEILVLVEVSIVFIANYIDHQNALLSNILTYPGYILIGFLLGNFYYEFHLQSLQTDKQVPQRVSSLWWLLPLPLGFIGGILAWILLRNRNKKTASALLIFGFLWSLLVGFAIAIIHYVLFK